MIESLGTVPLAWWDASYGVTVTGAGVSSWEDRVGGYKMLQATDASRPAWSATGFNGAPGLTFDGTDDHLLLASQPFPSGAEPCEVWAVVQQDALAADATSRILFSYGGTTGLVARQVRRNVVTATNRFGIVVGNGTSVFTADAVSGEFSTRHVVRAIFGGAASDAALDGGAKVSVSAVPSTGTVRARIGATQADTPTSFWKGEMRDVLVTSLLTDDEAAVLSAALLPRRAL
jgi:hypothetical protein